MVYVSFLHVISVYIYFLKIVSKITDIFVFVVLQLVYLDILGAKNRYTKCKNKYIQKYPTFKFLFNFIYTFETINKCTIFW